MSTTTATPPFRVKPLTQPVRLALLLVALAAVAASFMIGHTTGHHTTQVIHRVVAPIASAPGTDNSSCFRVGVPC